MITATCIGLNRLRAVFFEQTIINNVAVIYEPGQVPQNFLVSTVDNQLATDPPSAFGIPDRTTNES